jgi:hypothetical protein
MDFIKKHYEKIILGLVLLGVVGALVALPFVIQKDQEDMDRTTDLIIPKAKHLSDLNLSAEDTILTRIQTPYVLDFSTTNKVFNPVTWKKNASGDLIKVTTGHEIDAEAAVVTNITPLNTILSLESVETNVGIRYVIGIERQAAASRAAQRMQTRYASLGEKEDLFTITQAKGDPAAPDELLLKLTDTGEIISVAKGKPYVRADAYMADLRFDPEKKAFHKVRAGASLYFGGDYYNIVAITEDEVILLAQSNQKKTILHYSR